MRVTLAQLRKLRMPYCCSEELDLSSELDNFEDIISSSKVNVDYEIKERGIDTYLIVFSFKVDLVMECAISLAPVPCQISATAEEVFTTDDSIDDAFIVENQTIDTKEAILTNVLINKPMKVIAPGVDFESDDEPEAEEEKPVNNAFAKLKDLL